MSRNEQVQKNCSQFRLRSGESEDWLTEHLFGEEKKRLLDFADTWSAFNGDSILDGFVTGFRLGARFVLDTFLSDDLPVGDE